LKFSILLPTRDRLEYLRAAIETVVRQDYEDWELIVSDNLSVADVRAYVEGLGDARIKYFRTSETLPVTDNWNRALDASSGDYVLMLGDDDGLMPGYFRKVQRTINEFDDPDVIYSRALLIAYPSVIPGHEEGYVHTMGCATFFEGLGAPRMLETAVARQLVRASMELRLRFDFNMQLFTLKRRTIETLRRAGRFFHSPFPDYYVANLLFLRADRIVIHPDRLTAVGITPKSYGFFHFNRRENEGAELLRNMGGEGGRELERILLPGSRMNTCWLLAMKRLADLDAASLGLAPSYRRYRLVQTADWLEKRYVEGSMSSDDARGAAQSLRPWERALYRSAEAALSFTPGSMRPAFLALLKRWLAQYPSFEPDYWPSAPPTMLDLFDSATLTADCKQNVGDLPKG
jgi:glycosyltransferase involved in cell wall biosynthesis